MGPNVRSCVPAQTDIEKEQGMLDEVIERIDRSLPIIHQHVSDANKKKPPTSKKAKRIFRTMCDDPLLNERGDDIRISPQKKNGTRPD